MGSKALGIKKEDVLDFFLKFSNTVSTPDLKMVKTNKVDSLLFTPTKMLARPTCETDDSYIQLLPYVVLYKEELVEDKMVRKYLSYKRPNTGGEARLYDRRSFGWGGHIETEVPHKLALKKVFFSEANRELIEEIGVGPGVGELEYSASKGLTVIYQPNDPVGKYHLCASFMVKVPNNLVMNISDAEAVSFLWKTKEEITASLAAQEYELEPWSLLLVDSLT